MFILILIDFCLIFCFLTLMYTTYNNSAHTYNAYSRTLFELKSEYRICVNKLNNYSKKLELDFFGKQDLYETQKELTLSLNVYFNILKTYK